MKSIRSWLATRLLLAFGLILGGTFGFLYFTMSALLLEEFDDRLEAQAQAVIGAIAEKEGRLDFDWVAVSPTEVGKADRAQNVEVLNESGQWLVGNKDLFIKLQENSWSSNKMDFLTIESGVDHPERRRAILLAFQPNLDEDEDSPIKKKGQLKCWLVVTGNLTRVEDSIHRLGLILLTTAGLTLVSSALLVAWAIKSGLKPVTMLSREVEQIKASTLSCRLSRQVPVELLPMVDKTNGLLERLEASFIREKRFSADVAHELRTPVTELRTLAEVMLRMPETTGDLKQAFIDVSGAAKQMEYLVTSLLELIRNESDEPLAKELCDLNELINHTWTPFQKGAEEKGLQVQWKSNIQEVIQVKTAPHLLGIVLNNLFSNALSYTPPGGNILGRIEVQEDRVVLVLQNSAPGLAPSDIARLGERFWRKDAARRSSQHFGLGLTLVKTICARLHYDVTFSLDAGELCVHLCCGKG